MWKYIEVSSPIMMINPAAAIATLMLFWIAQYSGTEIAARVFRLCDPGCRVKIKVADGQRARARQCVIELKGHRGILAAERTALNFMQHLSGIATVTAEFAARVKGTRAAIFDTRKTTPGWRPLEKYAVRCGGGANHRMGLYDAVMLKDNHWLAGTRLERAVAALRRRHPGVELEIEADTLAQAMRAVALGADVILLDNMRRSALRRAMLWIRKNSPRTKIEVSGGVTLKTVGPLSKLGPDRISIGHLTHSAPALDLALDLD
jgi:nicotinate-nucleotide pyrophosphorylase (carboxylating)